MTEEELTDYSGCEEHVEMRGDLVTADTVFQITGKLIKKIKVPTAEVFCTRKTKKKIVNIHVPFLRFSDAVNSCNKFSEGSIIGDFQASYTVSNVQGLSERMAFLVAMSNSRSDVVTQCVCPPVCSSVPFFSFIVLGVLSSVSMVF